MPVPLRELVRQHNRRRALSPTENSILNEYLENYKADYPDSTPAHLETVRAEAIRIILENRKSE